MTLDVSSRQQMIKSTKMEIPNIDLLNGQQMEDKPEWSSWHCPGREHMEMTARDCLEKVKNMNTTNSQKMKTEVIWTGAVLIPFMGLACVPQIFNVSQIMVQMGTAIMLWRILSIAAEIVQYQQSLLVLESRLEFNFVCLGGWAVWLLDASLLISRPTSRTWGPKPLRFGTPSLRSRSRDEQGSI